MLQVHNRDHLLSWHVFIPNFKVAFCSLFRTLHKFCWRSFSVLLQHIRDSCQHRFKFPLENSDYVGTGHYDFSACIFARALILFDLPVCFWYVKFWENCPPPPSLLKLRHSVNCSLIVTLERIFPLSWKRGTLRYANSENWTDFVTLKVSSQSSKFFFNYKDGFSLLIIGWAVYHSLTGTLALTSFSFSHSCLQNVAWEKLW